MDKKISFGFSKLAKKPVLVTPLPEKEKIELIECLEGQSIKIAGKVEEEPEAPLVIPMTANTTPLEKVKQLREENRPEKKQTSTNGSIEETLEQQAAREIIENLQNIETADESEAFTVPLKSDEVKLGGAKASSMDDYDNVPIEQFGLAMLRGMGWKDEEHKEKKKSLEDDIIVCRPKGLGLGADKAMKQQVKLATNSANGANGEKLALKRGAFVRILAGKNKDFYGQVEGMDEESGRVFIKLALGGRQESVNEAFVQLVNEKEYKENRKVLNVAKYEEYKKKEGQEGGSKTEGRREASEDSKRDKYSDKDTRRHYKNAGYDEDRPSRREENHKRDRRRHGRSESRSPDRKKDYTSKYSHHDSDRAEKRTHRDNRQRSRSRSRDSSRKYNDDRRDQRNEKPYRSSQDTRRRSNK